METLGTALAAARKAIGMRQQALATLLGISSQYLCDIEMGRKVFPEALVPLLPETLRPVVVERLVAEHKRRIAALRQKG